MSDWEVITGDCFEVMRGMVERGEKVAHVITDPPYSEEHTHGKRRRGINGGSALPDGHVRSGDLGFEALSLDNMEEAAVSFSCLSRRWVLTFCDLESTGDWRAALTVAGLDYVRTGIWVKPGAAPQFTGDRPACAAEAVVITHPRGRKTWNGGGGHALWTHAIVTGSSAQRTEHTTQKPLPLMLELVELFTDPGDLILDPFCGSGTTGVACVRLGRRFIGIEKDAKYAAIARERLEAESRGLSLKAARAGQSSIFDVLKEGA